MAAVSLPALPLTWACEPSLLDYGIDQPTSLGSVQARSLRLGSRWQAKITSLASLAWADYQPWLAARLAAIAGGSTVTMAWPQPVQASSFGAPIVSGAGQGGGSLAVVGFTPGASLAAGLWFSTLDQNGRNYLYQLAAAATAASDGSATLSISPWLRQPPAASAPLIFASPVIEGWLDRGVAWTLSMQAWVTLPTFTITEVE